VNQLTDQESDAAVSLGRSG